MPAKLSEKERLKLIERVVLKGEPVSRVCQEAGISRVLFYRWLKRYKEKGTVAPKKPQKAPSRRVQKENVKKIIVAVRAHPSWSTRKISKALGKDKEGKPIVGNHGVQNVFSRLNLNTIDKRKEFAQQARRLSDKQAFYLATGIIPKKKPVVPRAPELSPEQRLQAIERVVKYKEPVAKVCLDFRISRPTFYKWLKRYQTSPEDKKIEVLVDKKPEVERYYRQTPEKYEEAVLSVVAQYPGFGVKRIVQALPQIAGKPIVSYHGVQNILRRRDLNTYEKRLAYAQVQVTSVIRLIVSLKELGTRFIILPVETRVRIIRFTSVTFAAAFSTVVVLGFLGYLATITAAVPMVSRIGLFFATIALSVGSIFFAYSMKYYLTLAIVLSFSRQPLEEGGGFSVGLNGRLNNNQRNNNGWLARIFGLGNGNGNGERGIPPAGGLQPSLEHIKLKRYPFVSIHLPFYNEKKVAERILKACTSMDYPHFEIIICDDSTDETIDIVQRYAKKHNQNHPDGPKIKVLHRSTRQGFKGGALGYALKHMNPKTEFVVVFDADFIPYPDTLELFIKYFKANNPSTSSGQAHSEDYTKSNIACIAGYQWHVLNKSENWITRGVRTEYAGSYVIERPGQEILGAMKLIHGSVYAIRADVLKKFGWGTSITEDFELTLKLYEAGYKVIYTPYIQGPAECVSTLKRLIRQRMRWAEGHSNCIKKMFFRLLTSSKMTLTEKLELLYLSPYYLQAFFFLIGTFSWLMAETVFRARLPFWTSLWGWSLVLTNFFSLPLVNAVGLFLEESEERDYLGLLSFVALSYTLVPFQAYASVKGFLEREEGPWFRTPKTGKITDIFTRGKFYRWIAGIIPGRRPAPAAVSASISSLISANPYVALATANNQFNNFTIRPKRLRWVSKMALAILLIFSSTLFSLTRGVPEVLATNPNGTQYLSDNASGVLTGVTSAWQLLNTVDSPQGSTSITIDRNEAVDAQLQIEPGQTNTTTGTKCSSTPNGRGWILDTVFGSGGSIASGTWSFFIYESDNGPNRDGHIDVCVYRTTVSGGTIGTANLLFQSEGDSSWSTTDTMNNATDSISQTTSSKSSFTIGPNEYLYVEYWYHNVTKVNEGSVTMTFYTGESGANDPNITTPGITIPENVVLLITAAPFIPMIVLWMRKRREAIVNA